MTGKTLPFAVLADSKEPGFLLAWLSNKWRRPEILARCWVVLFVFWFFPLDFVKTAGRELRAFSGVCIWHLYLATLDSHLLFSSRFFLERLLF